MSSIVSSLISWRKRKRFPPIATLVCLFVLSVIIRLPNLNRPLSENHEWVTAHTLITNKIWQQDRAASYDFNPIYSFPNPNDYHITAPSGIADKEGRYYYISFPPFAFIFPYVIFNALGIDVDVLPLQILNLLLHFICGVLIYHLIAKLYNQNADRLYFPALLGFCIYTFNSANLWYHSNVYFSDILVQTFFILTLYLLLHYARSGPHPNPLTITGIGSALFFSAYTEWIGVFLGFALFLYALWEFRSKPKSRFLLIAATCGAGLALLVTVIQYTSIDGLDHFIEGILGRYAERNGHSGNAYFYSLEGHLYLANKYLRNFFPTLLLLLFSIFLYFVFKKDRLSPEYTEKVMLYASLTPVLLHHLAFFEFTYQHDFALLKTSVFLALLVAFFYVRLERNLKASNAAFIQNILRVLSLGLIALSIHFYYAHVVNVNLDQGKVLGETISRHAEDREVVFIVTDRRVGNIILLEEDAHYVAPQLQWYSGRNIRACKSMAEVYDHMEEFEKEYGIVFFMVDGEFTEFKRLHLEQNAETPHHGVFYETRKLPGNQP